MQTNTLTPTENARADAIDALENLRDALTSDLQQVGPTELPSERLYTHDGQTVRLFFGYGFVRVGWGPRYINITSDLDADRFEAHGKRYEGGGVDLYPLDDREPEDYSLSGFTEAGFRAAVDRAREVVAAFAATYGDVWRQWREAHHHHQVAYEISRERDIVREAMGALQDYA